MFEAFKAAGGHIRLWIYQGLKHDCWTRAYDEPELPRWLLAHRVEPRQPRPAPEELPALAERLVIPLHPPAIKLTPAVLDALAGEYRDASGRIAVTLFRQGDQLYEKNVHGEIAELAAESPGKLLLSQWLQHHPAHLGARRRGPRDGPAPPRRPARGAMGKANAGFQPLGVVTGVNWM